MPTRTIPVAPENAPVVLRAAFEGTRAIKSYYHDESANRIVGKTGTSVVIGFSYGERVSVAYRPSDDGRTDVVLSAEPILGTNVFATPAVYRDQVADEIDGVLERPDTVPYAHGVCHSKEVPTSGEQSGMIIGGKNYSIARYIALFTLLGGVFGGFVGVFVMTILLG